MTSATTVLLVPSNGVGLGHVTRAAAIARGLQEQGATPILCTLSPLIAPFRDQGLLVEHLPSYRRTALPRWHWQRVLQQHVTHLIQVYGVGTVVFDGVAPYIGIRRAMAEEDAPPFVWVRRGRRQDGAGAGHTTDHHPGFRLVIQPDEIGATPDTSGDQEGVTADGGVRVPPIMLHRRADLVDRSTALADLGWASDTRHALVSLGTGVTGSLAEVEHAVCLALAGLGLFPVVARSPLVPAVPVPPAARMLQHYPLTPLLAAFDVAVIAAGYNSVAEVLLSDVPAVVIPNADAATDDQSGRAQAVARSGLVATWDPAGTTSLAAMIGTTIGPAQVTAQRTARRGWTPPEGARVAAEAILGMRP